jgi:GcrA cell cycle regulator
MQMRGAEAMSAWTEDAIERLRELHARKMSATRIADALNGELGTQLTRKAVFGKLFRLGLTSALASDADIPLAQRRTLLTLENQHCRWPVGEVGEPDFFFCGHPSADVLDGRPYCAWHAMRASGGRPAPRPAQAEAA